MEIKSCALSANKLCKIKLDKSGKIQLVLVHMYIGKVRNQSIRTTCKLYDVAAYINVYT